MTITVCSVDTLDSEHEKWKTYKNDEYGFECKYPMGYLIKEERPPFTSPDNSRGSCAPEFQVSLIDPAFKKTAYDAGPYSKEEIEKFGIQPAIMSRGAYLYEV